MTQPRMRSPLVLAAMEPRLHEQIAPRRRGENREPGDDRGGDEVYGVQFMDAVAAAHGGRLGEAQLRRRARSEKASSSSRGDLVVRLIVEVPSKLNADQLAEFAELMGEENSPMNRSFLEKAKDFFR